MTIEALLLIALLGVVFALAAPGTYWLYVAFASMREQMSEMRTEQAAQRGEIDRLRGELAIEREYTRTLARAFREATGAEPPARPSNGESRPTPARIPTGDLAALRTRLVECFDSDELDALAFDLSLPAPAGDSTEERARRLVEAARRNSRLSALVELARRERPNGGF